MPVVTAAGDVYAAASVEFVFVVVRQAHEGPREQKKLNEKRRTTARGRATSLPRRHAKSIRFHRPVDDGRPDGERDAQTIK